MRISRPKSLPKKPLLILAGIVLATALSSVGGWLWTSQQANADYKAKVGAYNTETKKSLSSVAALFEAAAKEGTSAKSQEAFIEADKALTARINAIPATPQLFSVVVATKEDVQKNAERIEHLKILIKGLKDAQELVAYQHATAGVLQQVITITGANAETQKALATSWQAMIGKLAAITPPAAAAGIHQQIIAAATATQATLATLPDLFTKKDVNGFAAKQKEIDTHIVELRALGGAMKNLAINQDKIIARDYHNVLELLQ